MSLGLLLFVSLAAMSEPHDPSGGELVLAEAKRAIVGTSTPDAGIQLGDGSAAWTVASFYYRGGENWLAKRTRGNSGPTAEYDWTDSSNCPQILGVLEWMSRLPVAGFAPDGLMYRPSPASRVQPVPAYPQPEGGAQRFAVWGWARDFSGRQYRLEIEGSTPSISEFGSAALASMEGCWIDQP